MIRTPRAIEAAVHFATWDDAAPHADASKNPAIVAAAFDLGNQIAIIGSYELSLKFRLPQVT